jgi:hypothetical protein
MRHSVSAEACVRREHWSTSQHVALSKSSNLPELQESQQEWHRCPNIEYRRSVPLAASPAAAHAKFALVQHANPDCPMAQSRMLGCEFAIATHGMRVQRGAHGVGPAAQRLAMSPASLLP